MQSTKEEFRFTKTFTTQQQLAPQRQLWQTSVQNFTSGDVEKLLVVLLVAFGTVCLLTNLLVLSILMKLCRQDNLPFRYRLIISQSLSGIVTSSILLFPLKFLSFFLSEATSASSQVSTSPSPLQVNFALLMSPQCCFMISSVPVVFSAVSSCLHSVVLYLEQAVRHFSVSNYKVMISGKFTKALTFMAFVLWLPPIFVSILPMLGQSWMSPALTDVDSTTCRIADLWTPDYANAILSTYLFLTAMLISAGTALKVAGKCAKNRFTTTCKVNRTTLDTYDDTLPLCPGNPDTASLDKQRFKATMIIRTVEPTPLNLSHSKSAVINFVASVGLTLPAILYYGHYIAENPDDLNERVALLIEERHVAWAHLIILLNGALGPVLHLLSDDLLCSQGLEMLTEICDYFYAPGDMFDIGDFHGEKSSTKEEIAFGIQNFAYEDDDKLEN